MALVRANTSTKRETKKKKRPGVNSKCRSSKNKNSKFYVKPYRGQGR